MTRTPPVRRSKHVLQLVLAALAAAAAAVCWAHVRTLVDVAPITEGQPGTVSVVYNPPLMMLSWLLLTAAGVLAVLGVAGLRRSAATVAAYTP